MTDLPKIDIEMASAPVVAPARKLDLGGIPVCSQCGEVAWANMVIRKPPEKTTGRCPTHGQTEVMPLRRYVTEVRGEDFDATTWKMEPQDVRSTT